MSLSLRSLDNRVDSLLVWVFILSVVVIYMLVFAGIFAGIVTYNYTMDSEWECIEWQRGESVNVCQCVIESGFEIHYRNGPCTDISIICEEYGGEFSIQENECIKQQLVRVVE